MIAQVNQTNHRPDEGATSTSESESFIAEANETSPLVPEAKQSPRSEPPVTSKAQEQEE